MTSDQLTAIERVRAYAKAGWGRPDDFVVSGLTLGDLRALLDEVERLRALAFLGDKTPEGLPYKTLWDEAIKMGAEDVIEVVARAEKAEAHAAALAGALRRVAQHLGGFIPEELEPEEHEILDVIAEALGHLQGGGA